MNYSNKEQQMIAFHYVYPKSWSKLKTLFETAHQSEGKVVFSEKQLMDHFSIHYEAARTLHNRYEQLCTLPIIDQLQDHCIFPIPYSHSNYPNELKQMIDPPAVLYTKGNIDLLRCEKVGIIGARKATSYSETALQFLVPPLVQNNITVVSGLADGADTMAHRAAMEFGGTTIAVLGHGFSHIYPKKNEGIAKEIADNHLLVTEYPPYVHPAKWTFPMRNRIISGLSKAIVVTEANEKSGTMSTVEHALDHGKEIFVVPGAITSPLSSGPNKLLAEGASPVWSGFQIVDALKIPD